MKQNKLLFFVFLFSALALQAKKYTYWKYKDKYTNESLVATSIDEIDKSATKNIEKVSEKANTADIMMVLHTVQKATDFRRYQNTIPEDLATSITDFALQISQKEISVANGGLIKEFIRAAQILKKYYSKKDSHPLERYFSDEATDEIIYAIESLLNEKWVIFHTAGKVGVFVPLEKYIHATKEKIFDVEEIGLDAKALEYILLKKETTNQLKTLGNSFVYDGNEIDVKTLNNIFSKTKKGKNVAMSLVIVGHGNETKNPKVIKKIKNIDLELKKRRKEKIAVLNRLKHKGLKEKKETTENIIKLKQEILALEKKHQNLLLQYLAPETKEFIGSQIAGLNTKDFLSLFDTLKNRKTIAVAVKSCHARGLNEVIFDAPFPIITDNYPGSISYLEHDFNMNSFFLKLFLFVKSKVNPQGGWKVWAKKNKTSFRKILKPIVSEFVKKEEIGDWIETEEEVSEEDEQEKFMDKDVREDIPSILLPGEKRFSFIPVEDRVKILSYPILLRHEIEKTSITFGDKTHRIILDTDIISLPVTLKSDPELNVYLRPGIWGPAHFFIKELVRDIWEENKKPNLKEKNSLDLLLDIFLNFTTFQKLFYIEKLTIKNHESADYEVFKIKNGQDVTFSPFIVFSHPMNPDTKKPVNEGSPRLSVILQHNGKWLFSDVYEKYAYSFYKPARSLNIKKEIEKLLELTTPLYAALKTTKFGTEQKFNRTINESLSQFQYPKPEKPKQIKKPKWMESEFE